MSTKTLYICDCYSEGLTVENDHEHKEVWFSLWDKGLSPRKPPLSQKIKLIWQVIKTGYVFTDTICLDYKTTEKLIKELQSYIKRK